MTRSSPATARRSSPARSRTRPSSSPRTRRGRSSGRPATPGAQGPRPGWLNEPGDACLLKDGQVTVAGAQNCRVLVINANRTAAHQIGAGGACAHHPPASTGSPNGDTPLAGGNLLVSEINGSWVSEYTPAGKPAWTVRLPVSYPPDPQQLGPGRYLIADYAWPGQIPEFDRDGTILYRYRAGDAQPPLAGRTTAERRAHGQRQRQRPHGRDRPRHRRAGVAARHHRQAGHRARGTQHPR
jgi:hypothetical protein